MSKIKINLSEAESLPQNIYNVVVRDVHHKTGLTSRTPYLQWELEISDGPFVGRRVFLSTSLSTKAQWHLKKFLGAIRIPCDGETLELDLDETRGRRLWVKIMPSDFHGKPSHKILDFGPSELIV